MIKGILFDKDGTLIDFYTLWLQAAKEVIPQFLGRNQVKTSEVTEEYLLKTIGVEGGEVDPRGALAYKSYAETAEDVREALLEKGIAMETECIQVQLEELFNRSVTDGNKVVQLFTDMELLADDLKKRGIHIGLATADTQNSAEKCLKAAGIWEMFDYIGADDGIRRPKPEEDMFQEFISEFGLSPGEVAVVGDTYNDILFARRNGGIAIGVLSGVSSEADFHGEADFIIESVEQLPGLLEMM